MAVSPDANPRTLYRPTEGRDAREAARAIGLESEQVIIRALIKRECSISELIGLTVAHFTDPLCQTVFRVVHGMEQRGDPLDLTTVVSAVGLLPGRPDDDAARIQAMVTGDWLDPRSAIDYHAPKLLERAAGAQWDGVAEAIQRKRKVGKSPIEIAQDIRPTIEAIERGTIGTLPEPFDYAAYAKDPDALKVPWILPGWFAEGDVVNFAGAKGAGKSTICMGLGRALSQGQPFCGIIPMGGKRKVLYLDIEQGIPRNPNRIVLFGEPYPDPAYFRGYPGFEYTLATPEGLAVITALVRDFAPDVVFVDSWSRLTPDAEQNDNTAQIEAFAKLSTIRNRFGCAFIIIDHFGKASDRGARGASAKADQADCLWEYRRNEIDDSGVWKQIKNRDGSTRPLKIQFHEETSRDGERLKVELTRIEEIETPKIGPTRTELILEALTEIIDESDRSEMSTTDFHKELQARSLVSGRRNKTLDGLKMLEKMGRIRAGKNGNWLLYGDRKNYEQEGIL